MVAAGTSGTVEFFAQRHQKTLGTRHPRDKASGHKKARREAGYEVQGKLEVLEKLTVVGSFAV